jgi:hypothetical protein
MNILRRNKTVSSSNNDRFSLVITVALAIILFEVAPEKSVWSIPVNQADEHMVAIPASGGSSLLLMQKKEYHKAITKEQQRFWKRILIVDDNADITATFKAAIEDNNNNTTLTKKN